MAHPSKNFLDASGNLMRPCSRCRVAKPIHCYTERVGGGHVAACLSCMAEVVRTLKIGLAIKTVNTRYNIIFRKHSRWDRVSLWFYNVCCAIRETPPDTYAVYVAVNPGEPGYEDAFFEVGLDERPMRFERPIK